MKYSSHLQKPLLARDVHQASLFQVKKEPTICFFHQVRREYLRRERERECERRERVQNMDNGLVGLTAAITTVILIFVELCSIKNL